MIAAGFAPLIANRGGGQLLDIADDCLRAAPGGPDRERTSPRDPDGVFPVCWVRDAKAKDLTLTARLFPVRPPAGVKNAVHDGAGIVVRFKNPDNYYVMRAIPHEKLVRLYKVENGRRTTLGGKQLEVELERWHELKLQARGSTFTLFFDGEKLFHLMDGTFGEAGSYGLWSKPNNVTYFDDLTAEVVN